MRGSSTVYSFDFLDDGRRDGLGGRGRLEVEVTFRMSRPIFEATGAREGSIIMGGVSDASLIGAGIGASRSWKFISEAYCISGMAVTGALRLSMKELRTWRSARFYTQMEENRRVRK